MTVYSDSFRTKMVQKMLMPNARPVSALAQDAGISEGTLYRWKKETILSGMSSDRSDDKTTPMTKPPHQWSAEEKLAVVLEGAAVAEADLGEFLRRKGVHAAQLVEWRKQVTEGAVAALQGRGSKADRKAGAMDARRVRDLERELRRKDKALAEAAALLILKKKGSSGLSGEGSSDLQEEVLVISQAVRHAFDDLDFVVHALQQARVEGPASVSDDAVRKRG